MFIIKLKYIWIIKYFGKRIVSLIIYINKLIKLLK